MDQMKHRKGPSSAHSAEQVADSLLDDTRLDDQVFTRPAQGVSSAAFDQSILIPNARR